MINESFNSIYGNNFYRLQFEAIKDYIQDINAAIINGYKNGILDGNELSALTSSQNNFIYYANEYFYLLSQQRSSSRYEEADIYSIKAYKNMRVYFRKTKRILAHAYQK